VKEIGDEGDLDLVTTVRRMLIGEASRLAAAKETCLARTDRTCMWPHMATIRLAPGIMKRRKIGRVPLSYQAHSRNTTAEFLVRRKVWSEDQCLARWLRARPRDSLLFPLGLVEQRARRDGIVDLTDAFALLLLEICWCLVFGGFV